MILSEEPHAVWGVLSENAKKCAIALTISGDMPTPESELSQMASDPELGFDLAAAKEELKALKLFETISQVDARRQRLDDQPEPRPETMMSIEHMTDDQFKVYLDATPDERKYRQEWVQIIAHDEEPDATPWMEKEGVRLTKVFRGFLLGFLDGGE